MKIRVWVPGRDETGRDWRRLPVTRLLISGLVAWENLGYITYFSTQQEISCPVLNSGKSLEIICVIKFGNSSFIFRTETGQEVGSLE